MKPDYRELEAIYLSQSHLWYLFAERYDVQQFPFMVCPIRRGTR